MTDEGQQSSGRLPLRPIIYRVHAAMLGIINLDGERVPVTIPINSELSVPEAGDQGQAEGTILKVADWNATRVMVFMQDLENRAIVLDNEDK